MEQIRKYILFLRKKDNQDNLKPTFAIRLLLVALASFLVSLLIDNFLPFNYWINMIRGVLACVLGLTFSSFVYIMSLRESEKRKSRDRYYLPVRRRFSYRQRVNLSIVLGIVLLILSFLGSKQDGIYTLKSSLIISSIFLLLTFVRRNRNEFIKDIYEIPDIRDLEFMKKKKERKQENELQKRKNKEKKES